MYVREFRRIYQLNVSGYGLEISLKINCKGMTGMKQNVFSTPKMFKHLSIKSREEKRGKEEKRDREWGRKKERERDRD